MKKATAIFVLYALSFLVQSMLVQIVLARRAFGQSNRGELRLRVTDPAGLGVKTTVRITCEANDYRNALTTSDQGSLDVERLPYGIYRIEIAQAGFAETSQPVDIHSSIPTEFTIRLAVATVQESVSVTAADTLINPDQAGA
ncbi:MAG: carboxypeptidase-like regulatory domain-containing protein, partial [Terriglobales bacterium]